MGASYSAPTLKSHLKMAVQRLMMHRNKKNNQISVDSKQVAILLQQGKDESARIRCEAILNEKNLATAYEMLQLMCELLAARVALVTANKTCPSDLEEGMASIIYCASRVDGIPELKLVAQQFGAKFGKEWAESHADNGSGKVHPRIVEKMSIQTPPFETLLNMLHEIATLYSVEWKPDIQALEAGIVDHSNPERLGSIAKIPVAAASPVAVPLSEQPQQPLPAAQQPALPPPSSPVPSSASSHSGAGIGGGAGGGGQSPYPGTLNLIIHRGRNILNLASQSAPHDLYVVITNLATKVRWKGEADPTGGGDPKWHENPQLPNATHHYPLSIQEGTQQIQVEVYQQNTGKFGLHSDRCLGSSIFYAETLRANPGLQWYRLYCQNMESGYLLIGTQFLPLNAVILSQEQLNEQRAWLQQEQTQALAQQNSPTALTPTMCLMPNGQYQVVQPQYVQPQPLPQEFMMMQQPMQPQFMQALPQQPQYPLAPGGFPAGPSSVGPSSSQPGGGGGGGGSGNNSRRASLTDFSASVKAYMQEPPESPPHNLHHSLQDIVAGRGAPRPAQSQIPASYDDHIVASAQGAALPDASYHALADDGLEAQPGSAKHSNSQKQQQEQKYQTQQSQMQQSQMQQAQQPLMHHRVLGPEDPESPSDIFSEFPPVPTHRAGAGTGHGKGGRGGSSSSSSSSSSGSSSNDGGGGGGGLVLQRKKPEPKPDPDADLEARFRALQ